MAEPESEVGIEIDAQTKERIVREFLSSFVYIYPNLNDTFYYACADTEQTTLDMDGEPWEPAESNGEVLVQVWSKYGHAGIIAYYSRRRNKHPVKEVQSDDFYRAIEFLEGWEYDPD